MCIVMLHDHGRKFCLNLRQISRDMKNFTMCTKSEHYLKKPECEISGVEKYRVDCWLKLIILDNLEFLLHYKFSLERRYFML